VEKLRPEAIFFDYGNTLASDSPDRFGDISRYLAGHGLALDKQSFERGWQASEEYAAAYRKKNGRRTWKRDRFWFNFCRIFLEAAFRERLSGSDAATLAEEAHAVTFFTNERFPDTLDTLAELRRRGYRLGVISNWDAPTLPGLFDRFEMTPYFEHILPSREAEASKPDPHIFHVALAALKVWPERAVHVGDSFSCDVVGARGVGITPIWLNPSDEPAPDGEPVIQIRTLSEVLAVVE